MAPHDSFFTVGPGGDEIDRHAGQLLDALEIGARRGRQPLNCGDAATDQAGADQRRFGF
jgi:hypothetical protein